MSDRIYSFGRFMTGSGTPSYFEYEGVQHGFSVRGWRDLSGRYNTYSSYGDAWLALDNNPGSAFYLHERAWCDYAWELKFNDSLKMTSLQYAFSTSFHARVPVTYIQYYDGTNWITLSAVEGSWSHSGIFIPDQCPLEIQGLRLYLNTRHGDFATMGDFQVYDIVIDFLMKEGNIQVPGVFLDEPVGSQPALQSYAGQNIKEAVDGLKAPAGFTAVGLQEFVGGSKLPVRQDARVLQELSGGAKKPAGYEALTWQEFVGGTKAAYSRLGMVPDDFDLGAVAFLKCGGMLHKEVKMGIRQSIQDGKLIEPVLCGIRKSNQYGILLDDSVIPEHVLDFKGYAFIL
jgi:hypothetical protein